MTGWPEEETPQLSGLQHFAFCRRQWALIHIEGLWRENLRTVEGDLFHTRAHDGQQRERRGNTLILRGLPVFSRTLGISGKCDVMEFHQDPHGVPLRSEAGLWIPYPVEYKRGGPKEHNADQLQLCAQAMCLEEMLCCTIPEGALFYGETRRRVPVAFSAPMRQAVQDSLEEMHQFFRRGYTPQVKRTKSCGACSLKELCLPGMGRRGTVADYMQKAVEDPV